MKSIIFIIATLFCTASFTQSTSDYQQKLDQLQKDIENITAKEKELLKASLLDVKNQLKDKKITAEQAKEQMEKINEDYASRIETRMESIMNEITEVAEKLAEVNEQEMETILEGVEASTAEVPVVVEDIAVVDESDDNDNSVDINFDFDDDDDDDENVGKKVLNKLNKKKKVRGEKRTTSQVVIGFGLNNLVKENDIATFGDQEDFSLRNARFYEWGYTLKTRLIKNSPLLSLKYGISACYNNLRPTNNLYYVEQPIGSALDSFGNNLTKDASFRVTQVNFPVHLEFDLSKPKMGDDGKIIKTQQSVRFGLGGYLGYISKVRQYLSYENAEGLDSKLKTASDYNTNNFVYGVSGYVGYKDISFYAKMDLNTLFKGGNDQNMSLGVRFDLH
jgi:hypothetical protein